MSDSTGKIIAGRTVFYPAVIKQFLKKSHYYASYDPKNETLEFSANHVSGGQTLFVIRDISHESAASLAKGLGLSGEGSAPLMWDKWNPILSLDHDGSKDAEKLRIEMLRLGVPHIVYRDSKVLALADGQFTHQPPMWTIERMLEIIRDTAKRYKKQLATKP